MNDFFHLHMPWYSLWQFTKYPDRKGFHYQTTVCIPKNSVCDIADIYRFLSTKK